MQHFLQRVEDLRAVAQRLRRSRRADRQDHEFLDVDAVVRVRAAVDDVHHRHRHDLAARAAERGGTGSCRCARAAAWAAASDTASSALAPSRALVSVPSSSIIVASRPAWSIDVVAEQRVAELAVDVGDGLAARPCRGSASCRRRAARRLRACRWMRPRAPRRGPARRLRPKTSASTVGLPRESMISRALMSTILVIASIPRRAADFTAPVNFQHDLEQRAHAVERPGVGAVRQRLRRDRGGFP